MEENDKLFHCMLVYLVSFPCVFYTSSNRFQLFNVSLSAGVTKDSLIVKQKLVDLCWHRYVTATVSFSTACFAMARLAGRVARCLDGAWFDCCWSLSPRTPTNVFYLQMQFIFLLELRTLQVAMRRHESDPTDSGGPPFCGRCSCS